MDMLSAHYGWTDNEILDLTPRRFRLALDSIQARMKRDRNFQKGLAEAVTKTLASGFKVMVPKKGESKFDRWIKGIKFTDPEETEPSGELTDKTFRGKPLPSAERLLRGFNARR